MVFNSVNELQRCIREYDDKERDLFYESSAYLKQLKQMPLFSSDRIKIKRRVSQIKKEIRSTKANKEYYSTLMSSYARFKSKVFLPFLAEYLTKTTSDAYVVGSYYESDGIIINVATNIPEEQGTYYDTIVPEYWASKNSKCTNKSIYLERSSAYSLLNGLELKNEFSDFPHLRGLGLQLVDLKLKNPTMSDQDRLNIVLGKCVDKSKNIKK